MHAKCTPKIAYAYHMHAKMGIIQAENCDRVHAETAYHMHANKLLLT